MPGLRLKESSRYWWLWIVPLAFLTYLPVIDNFFGWDDFLWLYRAKTLSSNPSQIFNVDALYFDPLVYLLFWLNFKVFGIDYIWYHIIDIAIHAINSLLVYRFVKLYSDDNKLALLSGLVFATSFAASDAVLWSSSRVDLLATQFSLITLVLFLRYIREGRAMLYISSIIAYLLALASKGTPIVVPVFLFWLFIKEKRDVRKGCSVIVPFVAINIVYLLLLQVASDAGNPLSKRIFNFNIYSYSVALSALFIPERILARLILNITFFITYAFLILLWFFRFSPKIDRIKSTAILMMFLFLAPVLSLGDFKLPSADAFYYLLGTPSHRIYLATIGASIFIATILSHLGTVFNARKSVVILPFLLLSFNIYEVNQRENIWESATSEIKDSIFKLKSMKPDFPENSIIVFVNFPLPEGFLWPFVKVYYDLNEVETIFLRKFKPELAEPHKFDVPAERSYFGFIRGKENIYDISDSVRTLMGIALNYQKATDESLKENYRREYEQLVNELNTIVPRIEGRS